MRLAHVYLYLIIILASYAGNAYAFQSSSTAQTTSSTSWSSLSIEQKQALNSLSKEWDSMDELHQKKWLGIAGKYSTMSVEDKTRVQQRVNDWVKLTPKQRMDVRENFTKSSNLTQEKKSEQWQQYQQLSDEEKKQLANEAKTKKSITNIQPESKRKDKHIEPLKKETKSKASANSSAIE